MIWIKKVENYNHTYIHTHAFHFDAPLVCISCQQNIRRLHQETFLDAFCHSWLGGEMHERRMVPWRGHCCKQSFCWQLINMVWGKKSGMWLILFFFFYMIDGEWRQTTMAGTQIVHVKKGRFLSRGVDLGIVYSYIDPSWTNILCKNRQRLEFICRPTKLYTTQFPLALPITRLWCKKLLCNWKEIDYIVQVCPNTALFWKCKWDLQGLYNQIIVCMATLTKICTFFFIGDSNLKLESFIYFVRLCILH